MDEAPAAPCERILLVDDDPIILDSLGAFLREEGYEVVAAESVAAAVQALSGDAFELVISDVSMPRAGGLDLLRYVRKNHGDVVMVLITGYGTIESAVEAIKLGAYDYLTKPVIDDDVRWCVRRACQQQKLIAENRRLREQLATRYSFDNIIGGDHRMLRIFELIAAVADSRSTVLMTGESGTGKSLVARAIHAHSSRAAGPFVEVACGSLPETLLESELFGYAAGAFTGAVGAKEGKFAAADTGTIFLDEIATASPALQVKLLRVLQERQFEPVGSNQTRSVDVRVVLATNSDLQAEVAAGRFRQDLYYRVNVINIELPPLRERPADIPLLARHFLGVYAAEAGKEIAGFDAEAIECLHRHPWPGNVRELENCIERAVLLCRAGRIGRADLPDAVAASHNAPPVAAAVNEDRPMSLAEALATPEREIIEAALKRNGGNRAATAEELQINRTTLYKKMRKYGITEGARLEV
ncbi:MAG: sigma-54-dependent Fis family transcriptional regulator [Planctomycetes bacterium]|nr:sigma-54-dependent Fis family transcriptional regulator [Planctomycetota bacterium]